jgi:hypothetical protein
MTYECAVCGAKWSEHAEAAFSYYSLFSSLENLCCRCADWRDRECARHNMLCVERRVSITWERAH